MKKRCIIAGLMLLVPCLIKADQGGMPSEHLHLSIDEQKNLFDQKFQNELEESLFNYQRKSSAYGKIRNASLLYTAVPITAGLLIGLCSDSIHAGVGGLVFSVPLVVTLPVGIYAALNKWLGDQQIEHYAQKLKEHRLKMAYLGQSFTAEQLEQYEQKLKELG